MIFDVRSGGDRRTSRHHHGAITTPSRRGHGAVTAPRAEPLSGAVEDTSIHRFDLEAARGQVL